LGKVKSTKSFLPWRVIYTEVFINKQEVRKREKYLKSAAGRKWGAVNIDKGD
jgi:putative endonuclease